MARLSHLENTFYSGEVLGRRGERLRLVAFCALVGLLAAACGSRLPGEVLDDIDASRSRGGQSGPVAAAPTGGTDTGQPAAQRSGSGPAVASGGRSGPTTGPVDGGQASGGSVAPTQATESSCAQATSVAPGVTDDEIKVASIVTDSGPLPGATEGAYRAVASYFAMINATGGLCGRKVTVLKGDDGLDPARARGEFLRLEPQVLAFTGSFAVADSGYIDLIGSTGVPYVGLVVEPEGRDFRNVMPRTASNLVNTGPYVWWKQENPDVSRTALVYADVGGVAANIGGTEAAIERAGFDRIYTSAASVASPDYTAEVRQAQDENIEFFYLFAFEVNMHVRMVRSMRQQNYDPPIKGSNIGFNTRFSELLGTDGDGWQNSNTHLIFLDPAERELSEDLARFIDWNERVFPGAQLDLFPVSGWGRAALFTDAMRRISGEITREALIDALYEIEVFDGGGIEVPVDPRTGIGEGCWNMAIHREGRWVREYPTDRLYECELGELFEFE